MLYMWLEYVIKMLYLQVNCLEHVLGECTGGTHYRHEQVAAMASIPRQILKSWLTPQWDWYPHKVNIEDQ